MSLYVPGEKPVWWGEASVQTKELGHAPSDGAWDRRRGGSPVLELAIIRSLSVHLS